MNHDNVHEHISDRDLIAAADGELPSRRLAWVYGHLAECESCSQKLEKLEQTSAELAIALTNDTNAAAGLSDLADSRAALRERLACEQQIPWHRRLAAALGGALARQSWLYSTAIVLFAATMILVAYRQFWVMDSNGIAAVQAAPLPRPNLTPGAALNVPTEICLVARPENPSAIPVSEREEVFREYGMDYRRAGDYELDHLITPALGGTDDIHNLWPEPYAATEWNAHVKDQLEDLLHKMVCNGQIDLPTAQKAIAANWIEAYKFYFHTDKPLASYSASEDLDVDDLPNS
jgi:hypothetical protein